MQKMYIGPTIPGLVKKDAIFKEELPEKVEKRAAEDKNFARLLVPMEKVMDAKNQLATKGSVVAVSYDNVEKSLD